MTFNRLLTDSQVKAAFNSNAKQLTEGAGFYLKNGNSWRFDFKSPATGKRSTLYIGTYPALPLKDAREAAQAARTMVAKGICPAAVKSDTQKVQKEAQERAAIIAKGGAAPGTFKAVALEFHASQWQEEPAAGFVNAWGDRHAKAWKSYMVRYAFPVIGDVQCSEITRKMIIDLLKDIDATASKVAHHMRGYCAQVFRLAMDNGLCEFSPASELKNSLPKVSKSVPFKSQTTVSGATRVMTAIDGYEHETYRHILQMLALVWQRPANVLEMRWEWLDLEGGNMDWLAMGLDLEFAGPCIVIPSAAMKRSQDDKAKGQPHVVPLSAQAVALLKTRREIVKADCPWVFPGTYGKRAVCDSSITDALHEMGFKGAMTMHGFRAMARTMLRQIHKIPADVLEAHLAHSNGLATGVSYDRATHLEERAAAVQIWADYLDKLRGGNVIPMARAA